MAAAASVSQPRPEPKKWTDTSVARLEGATKDTARELGITHVELVLLYRRIGDKVLTFDDKCWVCDLLSIEMDKIAEVAEFVRECKAAQLKADTESEASTLQPGVCISDSDDDFAEATAPEAAVDIDGTTASDLSNVRVHPDGSITVVVGNNVVAMDAQGRLLGVIMYL